MRVTRTAGAWRRPFGFLGRMLEPENGYVAESGEAAAVLEARRRNT